MHVREKQNRKKKSETNFPNKIAYSTESHKMKIFFFENVRKRNEKRKEEENEITNTNFFSFHINIGDNISNGILQFHFGFFVLFLFCSLVSTKTNMMRNRNVCTHKMNIAVVKLGLQERKREPRSRSDDSKTFTLN